MLHFNDYFMTNIALCNPDAIHKTYHLFLDNITVHWFLVKVKEACIWRRGKFFLWLTAWKIWSKEHNYAKNVWLQKLSISTLWKVGGNSAGFEVSKVKMCTIREKYDAKSKFLEGMKERDHSKNFLRVWIFSEKKNRTMR